MESGTRALIIAAGMMTLWGVTPSGAQSVDEFYRRNPVSLLVGSGAGGGFDTYARIFGQHFGKHVPGNPPVVVRNMPGAAGLVAMNHLYNTAPRDGSTILASFNSIVMHHLYGDANAKFDPRRLSWLGSTGKLTGACLSWHTKDVRTIADAKNRESLMGSTGDSSTPVMYPKLLNTFIGTKFKVITGYSTPGLRMAVEAGEVDGICGIAWETHMASVPSWIIDNKVNYIAQLGLSESAHMKGVPLALDLIQKPEERQIFELLGIAQEFGRPYFGPPGVPADRLAALQAAFEATIRDPAYLADAARAKQFVDPLSAREIEALIARAYAAPPEILKRASGYAMTDN